MDRQTSVRYRWVDDMLGPKGKAPESKGTVGAEYLMLRQQVAVTMDTTGWGTILVMADVFLSIISVLLYIVMTYHPINALYHVDLALACVFALNWLFWFWVAEDRIKYVFSFLTLIDAITIIPAFALYSLGAIVNTNVPGLNFLRVLRILRVLRVFRMKHIMRRHLEGAVMEATAKLVFSLLSVLFISAGLFYELEKHAPPGKREEALMFHDAIYWAAVTVTTVGYGDIAPSYWATQVMLIGLLGLTFTLLPYLTGTLMDALTSTSVYQRKRYKPSRRADVTHVVVTGFLDGATVQGLLNELYHEDKGFNNSHTIFLSERPPSHDIEHVIATHEASRKLQYLQGSPFRPEDLGRTAAEYACAVFIIAPKYPEDPTLADRYLSMVALSLGQYLQEAHTTLREKLSHTPNRLMYWITKGKAVVPERLPSVYFQMCLPEGRLRLFQVLQSLQDHHHRHGHDGSAGPAASTAAAQGQGPQTGRTYEQRSANDDAAAAADAFEQDTAAMDICAGGETDTLNSCDYEEASTHRSSTPQQTKLSSQTTSGDSAACRGSRLGSNGDAAVDLSGFSTSSTSKDTKEPGSRSTRSGGWRGWFGRLLGCGPAAAAAGATAASGRVMPSGCAFWQEFSASIHVMCLAEIKYAMMAQSVVGVPGVMTLLCNLSTTVDFGLDTLEQLEAVPPWMRDYMVGASQEVYQLRTFPSTLVGRTVKDAAGFIFDSCHAVLLAVETTRGIARHRMVVGDLEQVITEDMHGYIVADDISSVLLISAAQEGDFELWQELRLQRLVEQLNHDAGSPQQPGGAAGKGPYTPFKQQQQQQDKSRRFGASQKSGERPAAKPPVHQGWRSALAYSSSIELPHPAVPHHRVAALVPPRGSYASVASTVSLPSTILEQPAGELGDSAADPAAAGPGAAPAAATDDSQPAVPPAVAAVASAVNAAGMARLQSPGHSSALGALIHLLRSPSRVLRQQGEAFLRKHYHLRPLGVIQSPLDMVVDSVDLDGHILVMGLPSSQDSLLSLLASLRSKRLLDWRPVVIVHNTVPTRSGSWQAVAQFSDVYFIEVRDGLNDALLRASADRAAQAILMTPLTTHDQEDEDHRLASKVMTDALVINRYQLLKSLNPHIELVAEIMLPHNMVYLSPMTPVRGINNKYLHLLAPAYVSGSVFYARLLDDLMIASYCNNASDRIVLQLLHRWHMGWAGAHAFSTLASHQQGALTEQQQTLHPQAAPHQQGLQWDQPRQQYQALLQQQQQQQQQQEQQQQQHHSADCSNKQQRPDQACNLLGITPEALRKVQEEEQRRQRFKMAATAVADQFTKTLGGKAAPAAAAALASRIADHTGVPTLLQIPVECSPGTTYGRYFHLLLQTRGLLLLGVHRLVQQDGVSFRATITNPSYHSELQPDDHAFVVARLPLPADCGDAAAVAAAWPPDTLGFSNLDPPATQGLDLLVQEALDRQAHGGGMSTDHSPKEAFYSPRAFYSSADNDVPVEHEAQDGDDAARLLSPAFIQQQQQQQQQPAPGRHSPSSSSRPPSSLSSTSAVLQSFDSGYGQFDAGGAAGHGQNSAPATAHRTGMGPRLEVSSPQSRNTRGLLVKVPGIQGAMMRAPSADTPGLGSRSPAALGPPATRGGVRQ